MEKCEGAGRSARAARGQGVRDRAGVRECARERRAVEGNAAPGGDQSRLHRHPRTDRGPGRTGSLGVKSGNLVAPKDTAARVVINQMQPILVQYSLPQQRLPELRRYSAARSIRVFITHV